MVNTVNTAGTKRLVGTYISEDVYLAMRTIKEQEGVPMTVILDKALRAWLAARPKSPSSA